MPAGSKQFTVYTLDLSTARPSNDPLVVDGLWSALTFAGASDTQSVLDPTARIFVRTEYAGDRMPIRAGQSFRHDDTKRWLIDWPSQAGLSATLVFLADVGLVNLLALQPTVATVPLDRIQTFSGRHFIGYAASGPTTSQYSSVQLNNPSGSGVNALIRQSVLAVGAASHVQSYYSTDVALAGGALATVKNKLFTGDGPTAELRADTNASTFPARSSDEVQIGRFPQDATAIPREYLPPIAVTPGTQFTLTVSTTNVLLAAEIAWEETDA